MCRVSLKKVKKEEDGDVDDDDDVGDDDDDLHWEQVLVSST